MQGYQRGSPVRLIKAISIAFVLLTMTFTQGSDQSEHPQQCTIYVLLDKKKQPTEPLVWTIRSEQGFVIKDARNERRSDVIKDPTLTLEVRNGRLFINNRKGPSQIIIKPLSGLLTVGEYTYTGSLHILYKNDTWYLVNGVELEDYVYSVLGSESWPGWPLEIFLFFHPWLGQKNIN